MEDSIKYLNKTVTVKIDRPLGSKHPDWNLIYEVNYGGQNFNMMYATQLLAENLLNITKSNETKNFILPTFPKDLLF